MSCQRCKSPRIARVSAKCDDRFTYEAPDRTLRGSYVPHFTGIGNGDYVCFQYCLECGQLQGTFPIPVFDLDE